MIRKVLVSALMAAVMTLVPASSANAAVVTQDYQNLATGFCLDSNANFNAYTRGCNGGSYQRWTANTTSGATTTIKNLATSFCLDANSAGSVYTRGCNGGNNQKWVRTSTQQWRNVATNQCLDSNGEPNLYTRGCNTGSFQRWS